MSTFLINPYILATGGAPPDAVATYVKSATLAAGTRVNSVLSFGAGNAPAAGNVVLLYLDIENDTTPTPPAGALQVINTDHPVAANDVWVWMVVGDGTTFSYTITHGSTWTNGYAVEIDEAATSYVPTADSQTGTGTTATAPDMTTRGANSLDMFFATTFADMGAITVPGGYNERYESTNNIYAADKQQPSVTATGTTAITLPSSMDWIATRIILESLDTPAPLVSHVSIGPKTTTGTTTLALTYPTGLSANDMILACRVGWMAAATFTNETGWTSLGSRSGGTGTANDSHVTLVRADRKDSVAGTETGTVTFDQGGTISGMIGAMVAYRKPPSGYTWDVVAVTGTDDTHGTNRSIVATQGGPSSNGTVSLQTDDRIIIVVAIDTDVALAGFGSESLTAAGITFGSILRRTSGAGTGTGTDGNIEIFDTRVASGSDTVAPVFAFNTTTSQCGPAMLIRLRAVPV